MRVLECQLFFDNLEKRNLNFDFQFPRKQILKIKYQISIFNLPEQQNLKCETNFQFSRKTEIEIPMPISTFQFFECFLLPVLLSQRKPGTKEDRKTTKTNQMEYKGKCSRAFVVKRDLLR